MNQVIKFPRLSDSKSGQIIAIKVPRNFHVGKLKEIRAKAINQAEKLRSLLNG